MSLTTTINISKDFTKFPTGRTRRDGAFSGERLREEFIIPALNSYDIVNIELDGTLGYGSSFLEEAFGPLRGLGYDTNRLHFHSENEIIVLSILSYIENYNMKDYKPSRINQIVIDGTNFHWVAHELKVSDDNYIYFDCFRDDAIPIYHIITKHDAVGYKIISINSPTTYFEYYGNGLNNTIENTLVMHKILSVGLEYVKYYLDRK